MPLRCRGTCARRYGVAESEIRKYVAFTQAWLDVARTGEGWDDFVERGARMAPGVFDALRSWLLARISADKDLVK